MSTTTMNTSRPAARTWTAAGAGIAALALVAVAGGVAYTAGQHASTPSGSERAHGSSASGGSSAVVAPSNAIKTVQQELADLDFYEGPISGYDNAATIAAVKDLQRMAELPETGHMDDATRAALLRYLATGDNQMGGS